jgi:hypothetical protein
VVRKRPSLKSRREAEIVEVRQDAERGDRRDWSRWRSGALLVALLVGIGVAAAALIGVLAVALAALMDQALG